MTTPLENFAPNDSIISSHEKLSLVVDRIANVLPIPLIQKLYTSSASETGGQKEFPYARIDTAVILARDSAYAITTIKLTPRQAEEWYHRGEEQAFKALVWIEIGFGGLENYAKSSASVNWTSRVGHEVSKETRADRIMTAGKKLFEECLTSFTRARNKLGVTNDLFSQHNLEYLLDPFK